MLTLLIQSSSPSAMLQAPEVSTYSDTLDLLRALHRAYKGIPPQSPRDFYKPLYTLTQDLQGGYVLGNDPTVSLDRAYLDQILEAGCPLEGCQDSLQLAVTQSSMEEVDQLGGPLIRYNAQTGTFDLSDFLYTLDTLPEDLPEELISLDIPGQITLGVLQEVLPILEGQSYVLLGHDLKQTPFV